MGMQNSGELSDAAFAKLVGTWCLLPVVMSKFSTGSYGRLTDTTIVARDRKLTKHAAWSALKLFTATLILLSHDFFFQFGASF